MTIAASVRYRTASEMSLTVDGRPIGDKASISWFGVSRCIGVRTTPGATAFTPTPSFASVAYTAAVWQCVGELAALRAATEPKFFAAIAGTRCVTVGSRVLCGRRRGSRVGLHREDVLGTVSEASVVH